MKGLVCEGELEAMMLVKEAWIKIIDNDIADNKSTTDPEEYKEYVIDLTKMKEVILQIQSMQELINSMKKHTWDLKSAASFIVAQLSYSKVDFGGGWST